MDKRVIGVVIGVAGIFLWFMPFVSWTQEFMGITQRFYQAGYHIGGIAYLLLFSMFAYSVFSWFKIHPLRIISGVLSLLICLMFFVKAGSNVGWGLIVLTLASAIGIILAVIDNKEEKKESGKSAE